MKFFREKKAQSNRPFIQTLTKCQQEDAPDTRERGTTATDHPGREGIPLH